MFQFELTVCDQCGGTVKIVAAVTDPSSIRTYLEVGLPARAPPIAAARPHPQREFDMDCAALHKCYKKVCQLFFEASTFLQAYCLLLTSRDMPSGCPSSQNPELW